MVVVAAVAAAGWAQRGGGIYIAKIPGFNYIIRHADAVWDAPDHRAGCLWLLVITHTCVGIVLACSCLLSDA